MLVVKLKSVNPRVHSFELHPLWVLSQLCHLFPGQFGLGKPGVTRAFTQFLSRGKKVMRASVNTDSVIYLLTGSECFQLPRDISKPFTYWEKAGCWFTRPVCIPQVSVAQGNISVFCTFTSFETRWHTFWDSGRTAFNKCLIASTDSCSWKQTQWGLWKNTS